MVEVHGSIRTASCQACEATYELAKVEELFDTETASPPARACASLVKPDVVLFGELLPADAMARGRGAGLPGRPAALHRLLARGLSRGRAAVGHARRAVGTLAIVTQGPTPYDGDAQVRMDGDVVADLDAVLAAL